MIVIQIITSARGIAVFATMRAGLWVSGAGGSGVLIARKLDGAWSLPSAIKVQTSGMVFVAGTDVYDCVLIINTDQALQAFMKSQCTIGHDVIAAAGPYGIGSITNRAIAMQAPVSTYTKSRGIYANIQLEGSSLIERSEENERAYRETIPQQEILVGNATYAAVECRSLYETLKLAEGRIDYDPAHISRDAPPSDYDIVQDGHLFGVPDRDDPDPYGVLQLEKEGMVIREAGTHKQGSWEQFTFSPAITSPIYDTFDKRSHHDSKSPILSQRSSWLPFSTSRNASHEYTGTNLVPIIPLHAQDHKPSVSMSSVGTQTEDVPTSPDSNFVAFKGSMTSVPSIASADDRPESRISLRSDRSIVARKPLPFQKERSPIAKEADPATSNRTMSLTAMEPVPVSPIEESVMELREYDNHIDHSPRKAQTDRYSVVSALDDHSGSDSDDSQIDLPDDEDTVVVETPVMQSINATTIKPATAVQKARMVTVPTRGPPPSIPTRNPKRQSTSNTDEDDGKTTTSLSSAVMSRTNSQELKDSIPSEHTSEHDNSERSVDSRSSTPGAVKDHRTDEVDEGDTVERYLNSPNIDTVSSRNSSCSSSTSHHDDLTAKIIQSHPTSAPRPNHGTSDDQQSVISDQSSDNEETSRNKEHTRLDGHDDKTNHHEDKNLEDQTADEGEETYKESIERREHGTNSRESSPDRDAMEGIQSRDADSVQDNEHTHTSTLDHRISKSTSDVDVKIDSKTSLHQRKPTQDQHSTIIDGHEHNVNDIARSRSVSTNSDSDSVHSAESHDVSLPKNISGHTKYNDEDKDEPHHDDRNIISKA